MIINPEFAAAEEIARVLRFPSAMKIETFGKGRIELLTFKLPETSNLVGMKVKEVVTKLKCDILICTVERDGEAFIPNGDFVFCGKDVISIGKIKDIFAGKGITKAYPGDTNPVAMESLMKVLDEDFDAHYIKKVAQIKSDEYYVNMMCAWYFATALAKQYETALPYLEKNVLDLWTHNKTITKATESFRLSEEQKSYLKTLRRR